MAIYKQISCFGLCKLLLWEFSIKDGRDGEGCERQSEVTKAGDGSKSTYGEKELLMVMITNDYHDGGIERRWLQ